jgi:hypothetical protein
LDHQEVVVDFLEGLLVILLDPIVEFSTLMEVLAEVLIKEVG